MGVFKPAPVKDFIKAGINKPVVHIILIISIGVLVYSNTFYAPFHFDDKDYILYNPVIKDLRFFTEPSKAGKVLVSDSLVNYTFRNRYIGFLSFALNYRLHGLEVAGYHIVNLAIHIINALLVYRFILLMLETPFLKDSTLPSLPSIKRNFMGGGFQSHMFAVFPALLFVCHPIQTQAVTYISQRFASLATMFYLLSVVMYVKVRIINTGYRSEVSGKESDNERSSVSHRPIAHYLSPIAYYLFSLIFAVLAMLTKEISFTLPLLIAVCEFVFFRDRPGKRVLYLAPLLLTLLIIPLNLPDMSKPSGELMEDADRAIRANTVMPRTDYLFTQFRVIVTYIRLLFLPVNQNIDYDYPVYRSFFEAPAFLSFIFLLSCIAFTVYLYCRLRSTFYVSRLVIFGVLWFFIALSVESSVIPINDVIFEHRLYLPSVGAFMALSVVFFSLADRLGKRLPRLEKTVLLMPAFVIIVLSVFSYARNNIWRDGESLWQDAIKKGLQNARAHNELGRVYFRNELTDRAIFSYETAIRLRPDFAWAHSNLGLAYYKIGMIEEALKEMETALRLGLNNPEVFNNIGAIYLKKCMPDKAIEYLQYSIALDYNDANAHYNIGAAYRSRGWDARAAEHFNMAHLLNPERY